MTRQQCQPRPRWCALVQSPSRTAIALRDATLEVDPASAASRAAIDPPSTSLLSSTPPIWKCCGDQLNPPRQMLTRRKCQFTNSQIAVGAISTDIGMFRLSDTPSPSEETASASRYPPPHGLGMFANTLVKALVAADNNSRHLECDSRLSPRVSIGTGPTANLITATFGTRSTVLTRWVWIAAQTR